jgi:hypothetical protein
MGEDHGLQSAAIINETSVNQNNYLGNKHFGILVAAMASLILNALIPVLMQLVNSLLHADYPARAIRHRGGMYSYGVDPYIWHCDEIRNTRPMVGLLAITGGIDGTPFYADGFLFFFPRYATPK